MHGRIVYFSPAENRPTGGVKVMYRHVELLRRLGADAYMCHPTDPGFRCGWFAHASSFIDPAELETRDLIVLPEIWAQEGGAQIAGRGGRYAIFVQNGYLTNPCLPDQTGPGLTEAYAGAELVLSISEDSARMLRLNYPMLEPARIVVLRASVPDRFRASGLEARARRAAESPPARAISFMPRRMQPHVARVTFALGRYLGTGWRLQPIDGVDEATCASLMAESSIFLSFADAEGLSLPPIEAALAGNLVIGYTGQGGLEYWKSPNFIEVAQGDIISFVTTTLDAMRRIDNGEFDEARLRSGIEILGKRFSAAAETQLLAAMLAKLPA